MDKQELRKDTIIVSDKKYSNDSANLNSYLTPNIKYDLTLPRVSNIVCPNDSCKPNANEVIYIKYDHANMKYLYFCCHCDHFWKND
jgi:hypothetical protein